MRNLEAEKRAAQGTKFINRLRLAQNSKNLRTQQDCKEFCERYVEEGGEILLSPVLIKRATVPKQLTLF